MQPAPASLDIPTNVPQPKAGRAQLKSHVPKNRSRISNNREILPGVDQRLGIARRYRDLIVQIATELGGLDRISETRLQLIRRFAGSAVLAEELDARIARGEEISIAEYAALSSTLVCLGSRIGLSRLPREVDQSLDQYLRDKFA